MHRLVEALQSAEFAAAHPVVQAAFAHHALAAIHPFADGNGRVARALASVYLYRAARVPLLLFADRRLEYFDALEAADAVRYGPFLAVVADAGVTAMEVVAQTLRAARAPDPGELVERLQGLIGQHEADLDRAGHELTRQLGLAIREVIAELPEAAGVEVASVVITEDPRPVQGYRAIHLGNNAVWIEAAASHPVSLRRSATIHTLVSESGDGPEAFLVALPFNGERTTFATRDVVPEPTAAALIRLRAFARLVVARLLEQLELEARRALDAPPDT